MGFEDESLPLPDNFCETTSESDDHHLSTIPRGPSSSDVLRAQNAYTRKHLHLSVKRDANRCGKLVSTPYENTLLN